MPDRRKHPRFNVAVQVRVGLATHTTTMQTGNVSESGLFLVTEDEQLLARILPLSGVQMVLLDLEQLETIDISGRVLRIIRGRGLKSPGVAVQYDELSPLVRQRLRQFIRRARIRQESAVHSTLPAAAADALNSGLVS